MTLAAKTILVTGAGGMVGSYVPAEFAGDRLTLTDIVPGCEALDIRDRIAVRDAVSAIRPDVVLHLAAATDVDRCEQVPDWAFHTNAIGTQNVALACQAHGATMVYISTGSVFPGEQCDPYTEFDEPGPVNVYARAKLAGERIVETLLDRYYIVRAAWMIGGGERDKKFLGKIGRMVLDGQPLKVVGDKFGSLTYAKDLLAGIHTLLATGAYGTYHMANAGMCSRYDVALALRDILRLPAVPIERVGSAVFPLPAPRPRSEAIRNLRIELMGLPAMRPWGDALADYVTTELAPVLSRGR